MTNHSNDKGDAMLFFDGGDTGCGELLLELFLFMKMQPIDSIVKVRALDPGAPMEIPAWCRLTKNKLIESQHPNYIIKKKNPQESKQ